MARSRVTFAMIDAAAMAVHRESPCTTGFWAIGRLGTRKASTRTMSGSGTSDMIALFIARSEANLAAISGWVERTPWIAFLAEDAAIRSPTSVCFRIADGKAAGAVADLLAKEGVAYDIGAYRDAPPGLRIWAGATIETADLEALFPWLDWAWAQVRK